MEKTAVETLDLPFATIHFYTHYVVCRIRQGIAINTEEVIALHEVYRKRFKEEKYGYIFDRTYDYTINPIAYMECPYYADVQAFAVVAPNPTTKMTVQFEQKFAKRELKIFDTLEEARAWMEAFDFQ